MAPSGNSPRPNPAAHLASSSWPFEPESRPASFYRLNFLARAQLIDFHLLARLPDFLEYLRRRARFNTSSKAYLKCATPGGYRRHWTTLYNDFHDALDTTPFLILLDLSTLRFYLRDDILKAIKRAEYLLEHPCTCLSPQFPIPYLRQLLSFLRT